MTRATRLMSDFDAAISAGCTYGDFQFTVVAASDDFLDLGILFCSRPVAGTPDALPRRSLDARGLSRPLALAPAQPGRPFPSSAPFSLPTPCHRYAPSAPQPALTLAA